MLVDGIGNDSGALVDGVAYVDFIMSFFHTYGVSRRIHQFDSGMVSTYCTQHHALTFETSQITIFQIGQYTHFSSCDSIG